MQRLFRLWRLAGRDLRLIFAILPNPNRPSWLWPALLALAVFGLEPLNLAIPVLGAVDDLLLVPLVIRALAYLAAQSMTKVSLHARDERVVSVQ